MKPIVARFLAKFDQVEKNKCWVWKGYLSEKGYGLFRSGGIKVPCHRYAYEYWNAMTIPKGIQVDHLCRNRGCVNPRHLDLVTNKANVMRGIGLCAINSRKAVCDHGHEFTEANTRWHGPEKRYRRCRRCHSLATNAARKKRLILEDVR